MMQQLLLLLLDVSLDLLRWYGPMLLDHLLLLLLEEVLLGRLAVARQLVDKDTEII